MIIMTTMFVISIVIILITIVVIINITIGEGPWIPNSMVFATGFCGHRYWISRPPLLDFASRSLLDFVATATGFFATGFTSS